MHRYRLTAAIAVAAVVTACAGAGAAAAAQHLNPQRLGLRPGAKVPSWVHGYNIHFLPPISEGKSAGRAHKAGAHLDESSERGYSGLPGEVCYFSGCGPLKYSEGAEVEHSPHVYAIFWGSNWEGNATKKALIEMYEGLSGSPYEELLSQYFDHTGGRISTKVAVTPYVDTTNLEGKQIGAPSLTWAGSYEIQQEYKRVAKAQGWPEHDINAQYVVLPAPGSTYEGEFVERSFCAFHGRSGDMVEAVVPYMGDEPFKSRCGGSEPLKALKETLEAASHEYAEAATNPYVGGWRNSNSEIADICGGAGSGQLPNGQPVVALWSNHLGECATADPSPPQAYAYTGKPTEHKETSVKLTGELVPEGHSTSYYFEYGPSAPGYGSKTPVVNAGAGWKKISVSQSVTGLTPGAKYHFRLVAENSTGVTDGLDSEFTPSAWAEQQSAGLGGESKPHDVACVGLTFCRDVGDFIKEDGTSKAASSYWTSIFWSSSNVEVSGTSSLAGTACLSSKWCMSVGYYPVWGEPLAEVSAAGGELKRTANPPLPSDAATPRFVKFNDVSCSSETSCLAVGSYNAKSGSSTIVKVLVETWNGSSWQVQSAAPSPGSNSILNAVSCTSSSACIAVGSTVEGGATKALALRLNGATWTQQSAVSPTGASNTVLEGVACTSATSCLAVGKANDEAKEGFAEKWDGSGGGNTWTSLAPLGGPLADVSCPAVNACIAVGVKPTEEAQAEYWNGTQWSSKDPGVVRNRPPTTARSALEGVSCTQVLVCTTVGVQEYAWGGEFKEFEGLAFRLPLPRPVATTEPPTGEGTTRTLHATIDPEGVPTSYYISIGPAVNGSNRIPATGEISVGSGTSPVAVNQTVSGLQPGVHYEYAVIASNGEATVFGGNQSIVVPKSTVLCKGTEEPCHESNRYFSNTSLEAALKGGTQSVLQTPAFLSECSTSSLGGKLTGSGGPALPVNFEVTSATFNCGYGTLKAQGLPWHGWITKTTNVENGEGVAHFNDLSLEAEGSGFNCIFGGEVDLAFKGGAEPQIVGEEVQLKRTGGRSGAFCGESAPWTIDYSLSSPSPASVSSPVPLGNTVLCKTSEEPCSGANQYGSATSVEAHEKTATKSKIEAVIGNSECETFNLAGKLTGAGGTGSTVPLEITGASIAGCAAGTAQPKSLPWHATLARTEGIGTGTLHISDLQIEVELFGFNCIYGGEADLAFKGGSSPELTAVKAPLPRTGGRSGAFCGASAPWSATFSLSAPSPAWVDWP